MKKSASKLLLALGAIALAGHVSAAEVGVTADTIRIGMFGPLTGPTAIGSLSVLGAAAIYKDVNDHGGINGRKIDLVIEDDACQPNKTIAATKKLIAQDQVFMIHGGWCSGTVLAIKPELERNPQVPFMVAGAASAAISTPVQSNIFHPVATTNTVARAMVDFAVTKPGVKRIALISHSDEWGKSHVEPLVKEMEQRGLQVVETAWFERGTTDATSQTLRIRAAKPDIVMAVLHQPELTIFLRDAHKFGMRVPVVTTQGVSIEDMVKRVGNTAATSELYVFYPLSHTLEAPEFKKWADIFRRYNPKEPVETISFIGMTGALAVVEALRNAGPELTREKFIAELNQLRNFDPGIQCGPLTFTPEDHAGIKTGKMIYMPDGKQPRIVAKYPGTAQ